MPKRIAVFCDGTWNSPDIAQPTHVYALWRACHEDAEQTARYFAGAGTDRLFGHVVNSVYQTGAAAFGWGLNEDIREAYRFVAQSYAPGDALYIFGFSRGAYTARSLAGMIRKCGILEDTSEAAVRAAFELYRRKGGENHPDADHVRRARQRMSPRFATSQDELDWRGDGAAMVQIAYMGIWDTVGALGIPRSVLGRAAHAWNRRYEFHDTDLSRLVQRARHAVSLDEKRRVYEPTLWENLDTPSRAGAPPLNGGDTTPDRPYQQLWFIGDHGMVGGSGVNRGLTSITLGWIAEGAAQAGSGTLGGLAFSPALVAEPPPDPASPGKVANWPRPFYRLFPGQARPRAGPRERWEVHASIPARIRAGIGYDPGNLLPRFRDAGEA